MMYDFGQVLKIPTVIMRGGTSKGLILRKYDLPANAVLRDQLILRMFGSPDSSQIDGLGGGTSLTSKLALVGPPSRNGAHIDYTFGQVSLDKSYIDYNVTCGNLITAVGLYAAEEGYVPLTEPITKVHIYNTNIDKIVIAEIPVSNGQIVYDGDFSIDGVPGQSARIMLNFLNSGGTFTGKTLPTGNVVDRVKLKEGSEFDVSIVDCTNTVVFIQSEELGLLGTELQEDINQNLPLLETLEKIRVATGNMIGLISPNETITPTSHALPKICMVSSKKSYITNTGKSVEDHEIDILSRYISMGVLHRTHAVSGALSLATACQIPGTIPNLLTASTGPGLRIGHPAGVLYVESLVEKVDDGWFVARAANGRTARRLMEGFAYIPVTALKAN
ncbi:PrpF protein [Paenibacillus doosanensis]|uniref:2-methylaconitate cis-trans isomerase PrpF family protein n=1 Tax=Paenibacillus doosanensis TaxID=1229154 RepID=UPI00218073B3|nr:PrpF domain-containing protein [Paenibacillus doosanensis]MCS7461456.1 PrpF protein [Paenibacillus doosanensis]